MPAPYSTDLRQRVLNASHHREGSQLQLAQRFGVSRSTVQGWLRCQRQSGRTAPLPHGGGHPPVFTPVRQERLRAYLKGHGDATLAEIRRWSRLSCCLETVSWTLIKMGWGRKKTRRPAERDRPEVQEGRAEFRARVAPVPRKRLVCVDESGARTTLTREYGRAEKGQRVYDRVPGGHWHTTTLVGSLRGDGHTTCMVLDGAMDGPAFAVYAQEVLGPGLRPGDVVVWDNLSSHRVAAARAAIEARGAILWPLPPSSSDLNPIEPMWSKVKQFLRGAKARTSKAREKAIGQALAQVSKADDQGWFQHCGYA